MSLAPDSQLPTVYRLFMLCPTTGVAVCVRVDALRPATSSAPAGQSPNSSTAITETAMAPAAGGQSRTSPWDWSLAAGFMYIAMITGR